MVRPGFFQSLKFREMGRSQQGYGDGAERQANNHASKQSWGPSGELGLELEKGIKCVRSEMTGRTDQWVQ